MKTYLYQDRLFFWCSGCGHCHNVPVNGTRSESGAGWVFDGNMDNPTISPSVLCFYTHPDTKQRVHVCHLFLTSGKLQYLTDCQHKLAGQTVPLEQIPDDYGLPGKDGSTD